MAVLNYSKKCECCGGNRWEYRKETKVWVCMYCDGQVERKEQYDGMYTIKNVVRQVILDAAYRRMDAAARNLSECMKIDATYPGTLIAAICFRMIAAISGAYSRAEAQSALGQLRRDYQALNSRDTALGDDETALYEFMDSSDAWALLAVVFDALGDKARCEYLLTLVDYTQVFAKDTNKSLLRYAMKHQDLELAEKILSVPENVDVRDSLQIILQHGASSPEKGTIAARLISAGALKAGEETILDDYLNGPDGVEAKLPIALAACRSDLKLQVPILLRTVLTGAEDSALAELMTALFSRRLFDNELEAVMSFAAGQSSCGRCRIVLDAMVGSGQFISLNVRQAQAFIFNSNFSAAERSSLIPVLSQMHYADRLWESVLGGYLNDGRESGEARQQMLKSLFSLVKSVPAKDFENYVLRYTGDGMTKSEYIRTLFGLPDMNSGYFRKLAGDYMVGGQDQDEVRTEILRCLLECGLTIDSAALLQYVCSGQGTPGSMAELVQTALRSGTVLRSDALSVYLESSTSFSPQIFSLLYQDGCTVSRRAMENYVLRCMDAISAKPNNARMLASRMGVPLGSTDCSFRFAGRPVRGKLIHAYILTSGDPINLMQAMVSVMTQSGTQLNSNIQAEGREKKFSKFVTENRDRLSLQAEQVCQENRLFSRFFGL